MKFDGLNWVNAGNAGFSAGNSTYQSLAIINNKPYVAFRDEVNEGKTSVMRFQEYNL